MVLKLPPLSEVRRSHEHPLEVERGVRYLFPLNPWNQQRQFEKAVWVYPAHLAMYATYLRNEGHEVVWDGEEGIIYGFETSNYIGRNPKIIKDDFQIEIHFEKLPFPDRTFTDAKNPRWQSYGNYKFPPVHELTPLLFRY